MKIDDAYNAIDLYATTQANQAGKTEKSGKPAERTGAAMPPGGDAVQVSDEARLRAAALKAVEDAPAIRPEAVARGKALLESGKLGADAGALADRMIDALLGDRSGN